jgi:4-hydroxy-tetrahydrodipicolinate synthase
MHAFHGIWVPIVTPFHNRQIDFPALQALAQRVAAGGVAGLVVCGSTGEAHLLTCAEQLEVLDAIIAAVPGCPVIMGLAGSNFETILPHLSAIQARPIVGILAPPPCYIRPSQAGIVSYFDTLANTARAPIILYNIPYRTGVEMTAATLQTLADHPNIAAIKDCGGDPWLTMQLISDGKLQVLAGEDHQMFSTLCMGGAGAIAASAHIRPDLYVQLYTLIAAEELLAARKLFHHLLPLIRLLFAEPNPAPLKALLAHQKLICPELRPPMQGPSAALLERLVIALEKMEKQV